MRPGYDNLAIHPPIRSTRKSHGTGRLRLRPLLSIILRVVAPLSLPRAAARIQEKPEEQEEKQEEEESAVETESPGGLEGRRTRLTTEEGAAAAAQRGGNVAKRVLRRRSLLTVRAPCTKRRTGSRKEVVQRRRVQLTAVGRRAQAEGQHQPVVETLALPPEAEQRAVVWVHGDRFVRCFRGNSPPNAVPHCVRRLVEAPDVSGSEFVHGRTHSPSGTEGGHHHQLEGLRVEGACLLADRHVLRNDLRHERVDAGVALRLLGSCGRICSCCGRRQIRC